MQAMPTQTWWKRAFMAGAAIAIVGGLLLALRAKPIQVDTATVALGPMRVTVDEEGKTRIHDIYAVSTPVAGRVLRLPLEVGDSIEKNKTTVAVILPTPPAFHDIRTRGELDATIKASEAAVALAEAELRQAKSELVFAESDLQRTKSLARTNTVSERTLERAAVDVDTRRAAAQRAEANLDLRKRELESAQARLIGPARNQAATIETPDCCVEVRAPETGQVLRMFVKSEQVIAAGAPLLEVGDPRDLEVVVELLSTDAVKIAVGSVATIDGWGRAETLPARVQRIEPAGFTKVSALGIEEQRVRVILEFTEPVEKRRFLGHDFRVFARITIWESATVLRVPLSALFRHQQQWAVFKIVDNRARLTVLEAGHRNSDVAEVLAGLAAGDRIIMHPTDTVVDGSRVALRPARPH